MPDATPLATVSIPMVTAADAAGVAVLGGGVFVSLDGSEKRRPTDPVYPADAAGVCVVPGLPVGKSACVCPVESKAVAKVKALWFKPGKAVETRKLVVAYTPPPARRCLIGGIASGSMTRSDSAALFQSLGLVLCRDFVTAGDAPNADSPASYRAAGVGTQCVWTHPAGELHEAGLRKYLATLDPATDAMSGINEWNRPEYWPSGDRAKALAYARAMAPICAEFKVPCGGPSTTGYLASWYDQTLADFKAGGYAGLAAACFHVYPDYEGASSAKPGLAEAYLDRVAATLAKVRADTGLLIWVDEIGFRDCSPERAAELWAYAVRVLSPVADRLTYYMVANSYSNGVPKPVPNAFGWVLDPVTKVTREPIAAAFRAAQAVSVTAISAASAAK